MKDVYHIDGQNFATQEKYQGNMHPVLTFGVDLLGFIY